MLRIVSVTLFFALLTQAAFGYKHVLPEQVDDLVGSALTNKILKEDVCNLGDYFSRLKAVMPYMHEVNQRINPLHTAGTQEFVTSNEMTHPGLNKGHHIYDVENKRDLIHVVNLLVTPHVINMILTH